MNFCQSVANFLKIMFECFIATGLPQTSPEGQPHLHSCLCCSMAVLLSCFSRRTSFLGFPPEHFWGFPRTPTCPWICAGSPTSPGLVQDSEVGPSHCHHGCLLFLCEFLEQGIPSSFHPRWARTLPLPPSAKVTAQVRLSLWQDSVFRRV